MKKYPKKIRKQLHELSDKAYQRELDAALLDLYKQFEEWRQNKINCWDLNDVIHKFHDGISRELYKQYIMFNKDTGFLVAMALRDNILQREEIPDGVYQAIKRPLSAD